MVLGRRDQADVLAGKPSGILAAQRPEGVKLPDGSSSHASRAASAPAGATRDKSGGGGVASPPVAIAERAVLAAAGGSGSPGPAAVGGAAGRVSEGAGGSSPPVGASTVDRAGRAGAWVSTPAERKSEAKAYQDAQRRMRDAGEGSMSMSLGASMSGSMGVGDAAGMELGPGAGPLAGKGDAHSPHRGLHFDHEADEGLTAGNYRDMIIAEAKAFTQERIKRKEQRKLRKLQREQKRRERAAAKSSRSETQSRARSAAEGSRRGLAAGGGARERGGASQHGAVKAAHDAAPGGLPPSGAGAAQDSSAHTNGSGRDPDTDAAGEPAGSADHSRHPTPMTVSSSLSGALAAARMAPASPAREPDSDSGGDEAARCSEEPADAVLRAAADRVVARSPAGRAAQAARMFAGPTEHTRSATAMRDSGPVRATATGRPTRSAGVRRSSRSRSRSASRSRSKAQQLHAVYGSAVSGAQQGNAAVAALPLGQLPRQGAGGAPGSGRRPGSGRLSARGVVSERRVPAAGGTRRPLSGRSSGLPGASLGRMDPDPGAVRQVRAERQPAVGRMGRTGGVQEAGPRQDGQAVLGRTRSGARIRGRNGARSRSRGRSGSRPRSRSRGSNSGRRWL